MRIHFCQDQEWISTDGKRMTEDHWLEMLWTARSTSENHDYKLQAEVSMFRCQHERQWRQGSWNFCAFPLSLGIRGRPQRWDARSACTGASIWRRWQSEEGLDTPQADERIEVYTVYIYSIYIYTVYIYIHRSTYIEVTSMALTLPSGNCEAKGGACCLATRTRESSEAWGWGIFFKQDIWICLNIWWVVRYSFVLATGSISMHFLQPGRWPSGPCTGYGLATSCS